MIATSMKQSTSSSIQRFNSAGQAIVELNLDIRSLLSTTFPASIQKQKLLQQVKIAGNEWFSEVKLIWYLKKRQKEFQATRSNSKSQQQLSLAGPYTTIEDEEDIFGQISSETRLHLRWLYQVLDKEDHDHLEYWTCQKEYAVALEEIKAYFTYLEKSGVTVYRGLSKDARFKLQGLLRGVPGADQRMYRQWAKKIDVDDMQAVSGYIRHLKHVMGIETKGESQRNPPAPSEPSGRDTSVRGSKRPTSSEPSLSVPPRSSRHETPTFAAISDVDRLSASRASPKPSSSRPGPVASTTKRKQDALPRAKEAVKRPKSIEHPVPEAKPLSLPKSASATDPASTSPRPSTSQPTPATSLDLGPWLTPSTNGSVKGEQTNLVYEPRSANFPIPSLSSHTTALGPTLDAASPALSNPNTDYKQVAKPVPNVKTSTGEQKSSPQEQAIGSSPRPTVFADKRPNQQVLPPKDTPKSASQSNSKRPTLKGDSFSLFGNHPLRGRTARKDHQIRIVQARVRKDNAENVHTIGPASLPVQAPTVLPTVPSIPTRNEARTVPNVPPEHIAAIGEPSKHNEPVVEVSIPTSGLVQTTESAVNPRPGQTEARNEESTSTLPLAASDKSATNLRVLKTFPIATLEQEDIVRKTESDGEDPDADDNEEFMYPEVDEGSEYQPSDMEIDELDSD